MSEMRSIAAAGLALAPANPEVRPMGSRRGVAVTAGVTGMDRAVRSFVKIDIRLRYV